eukprot:COSAG01_NODE_363_length_18113_cov_45.041690_2_plen_146_part_00
MVTEISLCSVCSCSRNIETPRTRLGRQPVPAAELPTPPGCLEAGAVPAWSLRRPSPAPPPPPKDSVWYSEKAAAAAGSGGDGGAIAAVQAAPPPPPPSVLPPWPELPLACRAEEARLAAAGRRLPTAYRPRPKPALEALRQVGPE